MPHEISDNQRRLMQAIERLTLERPATTRDLGNVKGRQGLPMTADIARKTLVRLENRGFIVGDGRGLARRWAITEAGAEQLAGGGAKQDWTRPYVVLEEMTVEEVWARAGSVALMGGKVYLEIAVVPARNTEHAFKLASSAYDEDHDTTMVAIASRNFQPEPIHITNSRQVTVG